MCGRSRDLVTLIELAGPAICMLDLARMHRTHNARASHAGRVWAFFWSIFGAASSIRRRCELLRLPEAVRAQPRNVLRASRQQLQHPRRLRYSRAAVRWPRT